MQTFRDFMKEMQPLDNRFRPRGTPEETMRTYWEILSHIPAEALHDVITGIIRRSRQYPTPQDIADAWSQWVRLHPGPMLRPAATGCVECNGAGIIAYLHIPGWIQDQHPGRDLWDNSRAVYEAVCRCGSCDSPGAPRDAMRRTRAELAEKGYRPLPSDCPPGMWALDWPQILEQISKYGYWSHTDDDEVPF